MKTYSFIVVFLFLIVQLNYTKAQTSPTTARNPSTAVISGAGATWSNGNNTFTSNNSYATVTNGVSNNLNLSGFGFSNATIPTTATINGIQVDVERRAVPIASIAASTWVTFTNTNYAGAAAINQSGGGALTPPTISGTTAYGATTYSYNLLIASGNNRLLLVTVGIENVDNTTNGDAQNPNITFVSATYNGVAMTLATSATLGSASTTNSVAIYYLLEANLPATTGARNLVITKTIRGETGGANGLYTSPNEYVEIVGVNTYSNVNQTTPVLAASNSNSGATSISTTAINNLRGGDFVVVSTMNNTPSTSGGSITQAASYTENFEVSQNNDVTTGAILEVQSRLLPTGTITQTPTVTAAGSSRLIMCAVALISARVYDNVDQLLNASGVAVGNNYANTPAALPVAWTDTDAYFTYGGLLDLWGTTWTPAILHDVDFGIRISVDATNAQAFVDHVRITVAFTVILKATVQTFIATATNDGKVVSVFRVLTDDFQPYSYLLEKSKTGFNFETAAMRVENGVNGVQEFNLIDNKPFKGISYYRLRVDEGILRTDTKYSKLASVKIGDNEVSSLVYPNPFQDNFNISISNANFYSAILTDIMGRNVPIEQINKTANSCQVRLSSSQARGMYLLSIVTDKKVINQKILLE